MCSKGGSCSSIVRVSLDEAISQLKQDGQRLESLELIDAKIDDAGAAQLSEALTAHASTAFAKLYLNSNSIGDDGVTALCGALKQLPALSVLNLNGNCVGDDGAAQIAALIDGCPTLTSIYLFNNPLNERGCQLLEGVLARHPGVQCHYRRAVV